MLMLEKPESKLAQLKYAMVEFSTDKKFDDPNGFSLSTLLASQPRRSVEVLQKLVDELIKMNVLTLDQKNGEAWLLFTDNRIDLCRFTEDKRVVSAQIPVAMYDRLRVLSNARYQSVSAVVLQAVEKFLDKLDGAAA